MARHFLQKSKALLKAGGWSTAALAIAVMAIPADALSQDRGREHWNVDSSRTQSSDDGERGGKGSWRNNNSGQSTTPQDAPQTRSQTRSERPQTSQNTGRSWHGRQGTAPETTNQSKSPAPVARAQWQDQSRFSQESSGRNRTYSDPDRNRTYRDRGRDGQTADNWQDRHDGNRGDRNGWRDGDRRDGKRESYNRDHRRWDRSDWRRDRRYDWHNYRNTHRHVYRLGRYHAPYRNYYYRPLSIGFYLDTIFFSSRYWIADPWYYRLPPAYGPYRWVRYYDDALLVDIYTGEVVDVIRDFFW